MTPTPPPQCSIALWRGYATAQFYARDASDGSVLFFSPSFGTWRLPWRPSIPLREDPRALEALDALKAELRSRGWVRMRREAGSDWYECRFRLGRRPSGTVGEHDGPHRLSTAPDTQAAD